jgi:DNA-binding response OmpR family regulator
VTTAHSAPFPTVLVVDDDPLLIALVTAILAQRPYRVLTAGDGEEALVVARWARPDLVLLDLKMPRMNGVEACRALKADPVTRGAAVLLLSASAADEDVVRGLDAGADGYIRKPFRLAELVARLEWALGSRSPALNALAS